ncbi:V4R domain-containing protein, partial [Planctomycetota bacterium]
DLIDRSGTIDELRSDPKKARFFELAMKMALRLIINEGGWGVAEMDVQSSPLRVTLSNSQEARWIGPAQKPVCYLSAGVIAGYTSRLLGEDLDTEEVRCEAMGHASCVFEIQR